MKRLEDVGLYEPEDLSLQDLDSQPDIAVGLQEPEDLSLKDLGPQTDDAVGLELMDAPDDQLASIQNEEPPEPQNNDPETTLREILDDIDPDGHLTTDICNLTTEDKAQVIEWLTTANLSVLSDSSQIVVPTHQEEQIGYRSSESITHQRITRSRDQLGYLTSIVTAKTDYLTQLRRANNQARQRYKSKKYPDGGLEKFLRRSSTYRTAIALAKQTYGERLKLLFPLKLKKPGTFKAEDIPSLVAGWEECKAIEPDIERKRSEEFAELKAELEDKVISRAKFGQKNYALTERYRKELERTYAQKLGFTKEDPRINTITTADSTLNRFLITTTISKTDGIDAPWYGPLLGAMLAVAGHYNGQRLENDINMLNDINLFEETDAMLLAAHIAKEIIFDHNHSYKPLRTSGLEFMKQHLVHDYHSNLVQRSPDEATLIFDYMVVSLIEKGYLVAAIQKQPRDKSPTLVLDVNPDFLPKETQPSISPRSYRRVTGTFQI